MQASELRIGNYFHGDVMEKTNPQKITAEEILDFYTDPLDDYYKPIPLTKEWLVNLGFEKAEDEDYLHMGDGFQFGVRRSAEAWNYFHGYYDIFSKDIQFVHQLQNLFYAVNQYELTIKQEVI